MPTIPDELDPDKLILTKPQILKILDAMIHRWNKNKSANAKLILSGYAMKVFIMTQEEKTIQLIWRDMLLGFNDLLMQNAIARAKNENPSWAEMVEKLTQKIANEEI